MNQVFNAPQGAIPPDAQAAADAANRRLTREQVLDPKSLTDDEVVSAVHEHEQLIETIRNDARRENRPPTEREQRRIEQTQESLACITAEMNARHPPRRKTAHDDVPVITDGMTPSGRACRASARTGLVLGKSPNAFARLFPDRPRDAWAKPGDFFAAIANRFADPRLLQNATGVEEVGEDGGFSVPTQWFAGLIDQALQAAEFAPRCRAYPALSNAINVPMPDTRDRTSAIAGLAANWAGEADAQTAQALKWRNVSLKLNKLFILAEASNELASDGIGFEAQLTETMTASTAYSLDDAILAGTGNGMPLGIILSDSAVSITPESGQAASTLVYANLVNLFTRLHPACQKRATWFLSPSLLPSILQMVFPGSATPVLLAGNFNAAAVEGIVGTIFGRPVVVTEVARAAGEPGDIACADLSQYALPMKGGARLEFDAAPGFSRDVATWRLILRVSGQPLWNAPITPRGGGPTLSWATYLGARA